MKSKWLVLAALILSMLTFTACGKKKEESFEEVDPETVVEEAQKEVEEADAKKDEFLADFTGEMDLTGSWQDEVSQRATATVTANTEAQIVNITVTWSTSASESTEWTMSAVKEGNQLVYSDCVKKSTFMSEDLDDEGEGDEDGMGGGAEETVEYEGGSGSFEISDDGKLLWTGAADEDCTGCVFVKISE